ncbi:unnamed protein product [Rotaria socialis]|uniref:Armadillo repeat-containing protein 8 n=1 Tax=Rotaria socialis TaxID=392032 RepID=A0A820ZYW1_9BILA|nr:unnamed protein product [Rotaria socialis]CAF4567674.1 unnamed protein product [Rotaria socialis]
MPSYDDDLPTQDEEILLKKLVENGEAEQRIRAVSEIKNLVIGSKRCKAAFFRAGTAETLYNLLKEFSSLNHTELLVEIIDCISSFVKTNNKTIVNRLIELGCIQHLFALLTLGIESADLCESCLRCLRSFFLPKLSTKIFSKVDYSNPFLTPIPFVLLCDQDTHKPPSLITQPQKISSATQLSSIEQYSPFDIVFENPQLLDILIRLLSLSKSAQLSIVEILCCLCVNNERQQQLVDKNIIPAIMHILVENIHDKQQNNHTNRITQASLTDEYIVGVCLKLFCSLCYENPCVAQQLHGTIHTETNQTLCEIISSLLNKIHRPVVISYYAAKFFVNLCKTKVLSADHPSVSLESLTTLVHLSTKSTINKCVYLYIECLDTLIYLLNGNSALHHTAMYTEQLLSKLFIYIFTPTKILDEHADESSVVQLRSSSLTLLAVLSSHHEDIKKRIAEQENLISTAIDCCRSPHLSLQLAALCLFHGLSRSVHQLRTTFNDTICDILLDAIKSSDLSVVKISSCVISNIVLEFSTCRTRLLSGGILEILLNFLTHTDHDLCINSIWALRNLSYLSVLQIKQDIINGLTIDRIYSLLDQCTDEQFLLCLLSLLRNLFDEKDTDALLPLFNATKLLTTLQQLLEKNHPEGIHREITTLIDHLNSSNNPSQQRVSSESMNSTCRTSLFPEYVCDEMDQLDCS